MSEAYQSTPSPVVHAPRVHTEFVGSRRYAQAVCPCQTYLGPLRLEGFGQALREARGHADGVRHAG